MAACFGELEWRDQEVEELLISVIKEDKDDTVRRRALFSLGKIATLAEDIRRQGVEFLCHGVDQLNAIEKKYVAEAIGYIGTTEDPEVGEVILKLLEDDNEDVKREAGKALSHLNT